MDGLLPVTVTLTGAPHRKETYRPCSHHDHVFNSVQCACAHVCLGVLNSLSVVLLFLHVCLNIDTNTHAHAGHRPQALPSQVHAQEDGVSSYLWLSLGVLVVGLRVARVFAESVGSWGSVGSSVRNSALKSLCVGSRCMQRLNEGG